MFDFLCLFYGVLLGFYVGICKQCNPFKQQEKQYTTQDKGISNSVEQLIEQPIKYDRSELLNWEKYRKLSGFSNEDIKGSNYLTWNNFLEGKEERKEQNGMLIEVSTKKYCVPFQKRR